ncbi:YARHG domain-containing protein [Leptotrichia buccalis]
MAEKNKIEHNWYEILELTFYPVAEENEEKIKNRIDEKRKQWIINGSDIIKGTDYKIYLNLYNKGIISEQMLGKNNIREKLIKDARNNYFKPIDDFLNAIGNIPITNEIIKKIAKESKRDEKLVVERIQQSGKKIDFDEAKKTASDAYNNYCNYMKKKFKFLTVFRGIDQHLKILHKKNLYDFLISEGLELKTLTVSKIDEKRLKLLKSDDETSAKRKLYSECEKMLKYTEIKTEYDDYLKYLKYKEVSVILSKIKKIFNVIGTAISKRQSDNFINEITEILKNEKEAREIFTNFCDENNFPYNISETSNNTNNNNTQNNESFDSSETQKTSNKSCEKALEAIDEFRLADAQNYLKEAENYWSENPQIKIIKTKLNKIKEEIIREIEEIKNCIRNGNYGIAEEKYKQLKNKYPYLKNVEIEKSLYTRNREQNQETTSSDTPRYINNNYYRNSAQTRTVKKNNVPIFLLIGIIVILIAVFSIVQAMKPKYPEVSSVPVQSNIPDKTENTQPQASNSNKNNSENENSSQVQNNNDQNQNNQIQQEKTSQEQEIISIDDASNLSDLLSRVRQIKKKVLSGDQNILKNYTPFGLQIIRNSFYAEHGYIFQKNQDMNEYFNNLSGYEESNPDATTIEQNFSQEDRNFINIVRTMEK